MKTLVARLDLGRYKATIKGLTQFGDRRQGTDRNLAAVDWIEAQLQSYGCVTERLRYMYQPPAASPQPQGRAGGPPSPVIASGEVRLGQGGSRLRGITRPTGVNNNPEAQPDVALRTLNTQPSDPWPTRAGLLHQSRHHSSRRDVHRRSPHGRHRMGRSCQ